MIKNVTINIVYSTETNPRNL